MTVIGLAEVLLGSVAFLPAIILIVAAIYGIAVLRDIRATAHRIEEALRGPGGGAA